MLDMMKTVGIEHIFSKLIPNHFPRVKIESVYGDYVAAKHHVNEQLIITHHPEQIRGGGLLRYCNLLVRGFQIPKDVDKNNLEKTMCSRFFIDFDSIDNQQNTIDRYLTNHFIGEEELKFDFLVQLKSVLEKNSGCLMGVERRDIINAVTVTAYIVMCRHGLSSNMSGVRADLVRQQRQQDSINNRERLQHERQNELIQNMQNNHNHQNQQIHQTQQNQQIQQTQQVLQNQQNQQLQNKFQNLTRAHPNFQNWQNNHQNYLQNYQNHSSVIRSKFGNSAYTTLVPRLENQSCLNSVQISPGSAISDAPTVGSSKLLTTPTEISVPGISVSGINCPVITVPEPLAVPLSSSTSPCPLSTSSRQSPISSLSSNSVPTVVKTSSSEHSENKKNGRNGGGKEDGNTGKNKNNGNKNTCNNSNNNKNSKSGKTGKTQTPAKNGNEKQAKQGAQPQNLKTQEKHASKASSVKSGSVKAGSVKSQGIKTGNLKPAEKKDNQQKSGKTGVNGTSSGYASEETTSASPPPPVSQNSTPAVPSLETSKKRTPSSDSGFSAKQKQIQLLLQQAQQKQRVLQNQQNLNLENLQNQVNSNPSLNPNQTTPSLQDQAIQQSPTTRIEPPMNQSSSASTSSTTSSASSTPVCFNCIHGCHLVYQSVCWALGEITKQDCLIEPHCFLDLHSYSAFPENGETEGEKTSKTTNLGCSKAIMDMVTALVSTEIIRILKSMKHPIQSQVQQQVQYARTVQASDLQQQHYIAGLVQNHQIQQSLPQTNGNFNFQQHNPNSFQSNQNSQGNYSQNTQNSNINFQLNSAFAACLQYQQQQYRQNHQRIPQQHTGINQTTLASLLASLQSNSHQSAPKLSSSQQQSQQFLNQFALAAKQQKMANLLQARGAEGGQYF